MGEISIGPCKFRCSGHFRNGTNRRETSENLGGRGRSRGGNHRGGGGTNQDRKGIVWVVLVQGLSSSVHSGIGKMEAGGTKATPDRKWGVSRHTVVRVKLQRSGKQGAAWWDILCEGIASKKSARAILARKGTSFNVLEEGQMWGGT